MANSDIRKLIEYEEIMKEWDWKKNNEIGLDPSKLLLGSNKYAWWICSKGHSYQSIISNRTLKHSGCPYCSNYRVLEGFNDLKTLFPNLAKEFDIIKNNITPNLVLAGGEKKYWWICPNGHSYETSMNRRTLRGNGCPYCSGHRVLSGFNDISTTHPNLVKEWDYDKNKHLNILDLSKGSSTLAWWICPNGHSYRSKIIDRCRGHGCPYCYNTKVLKGFNDLETTNPQLAKEWHPTKNGDVRPCDVFKGTAKKYWWLCEHGHEWQQSPHLRSKGRGCPMCSNEIHVSFPEKVFYYYISKKFDAVEQNYNPKWNNQRNIDIYIPKYKIGIEYDGKRWHQNIESDLLKNELCRDYKIALIRIREEGCPLLNDSSFDFVFSNNYEAAFDFIAETIKKVIGIEYKFNIDLDKDRTIINELVLSSEKNNNICVTNPDIIKEWDYEKNGFLKPEFLTKGSTKKVWWRCKNGHSWLASISNRCRLGRGCSMCSNKSVEKGVNDLFHLYPTICLWWDYKKNKKQPNEFVAGSGIKVWWECKQGHSFEKSIRDMVKKPQCPLCKDEILSFFPKQITKNQHYVQQKYLKQWTVDDNKNQIYCSYNSSCTVPIKSICQAKEFYKLEPINKIEYNFLIGLINTFPNKDYVEDYKKMIDFYLFLNKFNFFGTEFEKPMNDLLIQAGEEITKMHEKVLNNEVFNSLIKCDEEIMLDIEKKYSLLSYVFYQFFRTKKTREKLCKNIESIISKEKLTDIRPMVMAKYLCNVFGLRAADASMDTDYHIQYFKNDKKNFITSDNPVFIINEIDLEKVDDFLYIVSPSLAIIISTKKEYFGVKDVCDEEIDFINNCVVDNSHGCIISNDICLLKKYKH